MWLIKYILDIIFPDFCLGCKKRGFLICPNCLEENTLNNNNEILSLYEYKNPLIKEVLWRLKYKNDKRVANFFGKLIYQNFIEDFADLKMYTIDKPIILLPVPLSDKRIKERSYNQSLLIAKAIKREDASDLFEIRNDILIKKEGIPQTKIKNKQQRLLNIEDSFILNNKKIENRIIIIVDDITTTGATISEIKKLLKEAKKVVGLTIAH
ncbi:MAG: phosphoribosyltransferase family protein [Patescibacteria group bacterium]|nr:phosphoribosyltransferase family protein [Patescibacteria group bacterium]